MGSSAFTSALDGADQLLSLPPINRKSHISCRLFEDQLKSQLNKKYSTFIFAINGSVASDQYMILSALCQMHCLPKIIIYGATARDFINNGLFCPANTPVFQCLDQCFNIGSRYQHAYDNNGNWLFSLLHEHLYFFRESAKLKNLSSILYEKLLPPYSKNQDLVSNADESKATVLPNTLQLQKANSIPLLSKERRAKYLLDRRRFLRSDLRTYSLTYKPFPSYGYKQQLHSLDEIISICRAKAIHLILVNMPTSRENIELLGENAYQNYLADIGSRVNKGGYTFIDMNALEKFSCGYFYDSVHLNPTGAKIFTTKLVRNLSLFPIPLLTSNQRKCNDTKFSSVDNMLSLNDKNSNTNSQRQENVIDGLASWWLAKAYFAAPKSPDIVILGNSQLGPLLGADAYVYDRLIDITGDHRSYVLEHDMRALLNKNWKVFVGALPMATLSDQLAISRALFSSKYKPKLVALTISPRDFIDNCFSPTCTEASSFFGKYANPNSTTSGLKSTLEKMRVQKYPFTEASNDNLQPNNNDNSEDISPLLLGKPFQHISPGQIIIGSSDGYSFVDNTEEYRQIYKNPFSTQLKFQMHCFDILLAYLAQQHIKVVVFGLPLTNTNRKLLSADFYTTYNQQIIEICKKHDADWIDIDKDFPAFTDKQFMDSTHLNLPGGLRLTSTIALFAANKFHWRTFAELQNDEKKMF